MSQQSNDPTGSTNHFDAAKSIVNALRTLDKPSQELAMRFAAESLNLQVPHAPSPSQSSVHQTPSPPPGGGGVTHSTDIKQFTAAKAPKSDQQFAAVVAYFYRFEAPESERSDTIDAAALTEAARLAGRRRPAKAKFTLNNAKAAGYLDGVGAGKFRINSVGENLVAMALPGDGSGDSTNGRQTRKKTATRKSAKTDSTKSVKKTTKRRT